LKQGATMIEKLLDGRFLLLEPIGSGGEARVFRARDVILGHEVAARLALRPVTHETSGVLPSFHPGWVTLLHLGTDPQQGPYQIYELLDGPTIGQLVKTGPLGTGSWRRLVEQSLDAVTALHEAGWVHGDLNAENIMQAKMPDSPWKLIELPFLRFEPQAERSTLFGSIHTLAPEQFSGKPAEVRSDLYALGCLYYFAATGEFPHSGGTSQEVAIERLRFAPRALIEKAPGLPAAWSAWVMTLLAREPQDRFPSAAAARQLLGVA